MTSAYQTFIQDRNLEPMTLFHIPFHVNPFTYECVTNFLDVDTPTLAGGYVHMNFGTQPPIHHLTGFTGIEGRKGIDKLKALRAFIGSTQVILPFQFPSRYGPETKWVYLQSFSDTMSADMHLYNQYDFTLVEYGAATITPAQPLPPAVGAAMTSLINVAYPVTQTVAAAVAAAAKLANY